MKKLELILEKYRTLYQASKETGIHASQLQRWLQNDAHIDDKGDVYIRTKGQLITKESEL